MIKSSHKGFAETLLFVLNVFIIFLLLAGNKISIPHWLQPVGRLHPVILHFPIVILMMGMLFEFFRFKTAFRNEKLFQDFTTVLLLTGTVLAGITAIMGLFLSKEAGYSGNTLLWHKWAGVTVVFISTAVYLCRNQPWYNGPAAKSGAVLTVFFLVFAGHYGADITHGENFILGPVLNNPSHDVPLDKALVFQDVIQPIFENKCTSCHNDDKLKGGLMLTDENSVLKGGKTGKLFIPGNPQMSLLLQRIHLPDDDDHHMPPAGKTQLTPDEMRLLYLWVKENAGFKRKVIDLPANDSLRLLAATFLKPAQSTRESYDFAAADDKTIKKLNNNYRVVYAIAKSSPALAVNVYNKSTYSPKVLTELSAVKTQIISLNLDRMPVKDAELKTIAQFVNLRTLNLDFTDVDGSGLKYLAALKHLKSLSLAGNSLNPGAFRQITAIKSLTETAIWDTGLPDTEIQQLQKTDKTLTLIKGFKDDGKPIKLNVPFLKNTTAVFSQPFALQLRHPIKGVDIRYTTDGSGPDSVKSMLYKPGVMITGNTTIKARAFKKGWYGSDTVTFSFYRSGFKPDSIWFLTSPSPFYPAYGAKTLTDGQLGTTNLNVNWVGFQKTNMEVVCQYKQPVKISAITLHVAAFPEFLITPPGEIQIWGGVDMAHLKLINTTKVKPVQKTGKLLFDAIDCKFKPKKISCLKIIAKPDGIMLVDEMLVN